MKVAILYNGLYKADGTTLSIGGIETYLLRLAELINDLGWESVIFQLADLDFERNINQVTVWGRSGISSESPAHDVRCFLTGCAEKWLAGGKGIIICGSEGLFEDSATKTIVIQHGVSWDLPSTNTSGVPGKFIRIIPPRYHGTALDLINRFRASRLNQLRRTWMATSNNSARIEKFNRFMVCVDYNYLNVLKAQGKFSKARTWIIPNFAQLTEPGEFSRRRERATCVKILFARRFIWYRGTRLIAPVFKRILGVCPNVSITFAGDGPDENFLRNYFVDTESVTFLKYSYDESGDVLLSHDIAVIPSLGSEGTSLSAIEAMGAGCAVLATCVGGLTNIIIDNYNGKLVMPSEEDLFLALHELVTNIKLRHRLAERAYATVKESLNIDLWREKWRRVLEHVSQAQQ